MKPLIVLLCVFGLTCLSNFIFEGNVGHVAAGCTAMALMLVFTSIAHFKFAKGMVMMIAPVIPMRKAIVYITGVMEVLLGVGFAAEKIRHPAAWAIIIFFVLLLPANIYAAQKRVDLEKANHQGKGLDYLWFRIPLQLFFIAWVYYFGLMNI